MNEPSKTRRRGIVAFASFAAIAVIAVVVTVLALGWDRPFAARANPETEDAYAEGEVTPVSPRVEGYLRSLGIDDNQAVKAGQVIAELVDDDYRATAAQAQADLDAACAQLDQLRQEQRVMELQIQEAGEQAAGTYAQQRRAGEETARQSALLPTALGLRRSYDSALADSGRLAAQAHAQDAQTEQRRRELTVLAAQQSQAAATVDVRRAQLDLANIRLGYTVIRAPADGTVGARQVRVGLLLQPGTTITTLTPLDAVWVVGSFTERQLTEMRPGQPARVRFDAFPNIELPAHVAGLSPLTGEQLAAMPGDNVTGNYTKVVQRIPVKVTLDPEGNSLRGRIRPGMSALVRVDTSGGDGVRRAR